jgi:hypothetical protein
MFTLSKCQWLRLEHLHVCKFRVVRNVPSKLKLSFLCNEWLQLEDILLTHCRTQDIYHLFPLEYQGSSKTLEELKSSTEREIFAIPSDILQSVVSDSGMRLRNIVEFDDKHTEHMTI